MRFCPSRRASHHQETSFCLCLLVLLAASVFVDAQTPSIEPEENPGAPTEQKDVRREDPKKIAKYDVNRIGHRGVGHGFNIYSLKRERQLGETLAAAFNQNSRIVNDPILNDYVNRLAQRIVRNSDAEVPFTVRLIDSSEIPRAYGLPGGFLYVDSALIFAADSEAELASVMAHEIAHVAARHATRALTRKDLLKLTSELSLLTGPAGVIMEDAGGVAGPLSVKKFSRDSEYEADLLGIEYAYSAGYDPEALLSALEKLRAMEADRSAAFAKIPGYHLATKLPFHEKVARGFSNYPVTEDRIRRLQSEIAAFLPDRKEYIVDTDEFQEIKSHLLSLRGPLQIRRHSDDADPKGPVLRRMPQDNTDVATTTRGNLRSVFTTLR
ncbi:MAG TPA: M48 family metalloprotease [Candidatus Sulfotelmatobacter sp.]|nr:M48 family metalloprotease [Candidatus Sulfotelmatobacter sp.]